MEHIKINQKTYGYAVGYRDNNKLRNSFNNLVRKTYGFDFEEWYQNGYWQDRYIPYSLLDGNDIVSNVSVNIMDFCIMGEERTFIQIGTVMTDKDYRNQGLNRFLMEKVLEKWKDRCELIYLFANDSVLDFYPKFGFISIPEYQHSKGISVVNPTPNSIKLNMKDKKNKDLLYNIIHESVDFSQLAMRDNASLVMFYCTSFMNQSVYYIKDLDAIVIADYSGDTLYLHDVFCRQALPLDDIIIAIVNKDIIKIVLGFTPKDTTSYDEALLNEEDTTLFVLGDRYEILNNRKRMFPVLSHA